MVQLFHKAYRVLEAHTAAEIGSGGLEVLSTPSMIAFMENAAYTYCQELIGDQLGQTSVGTSLQVKHLKASPVGAVVEVFITEAQKQDRTVNFAMEAFVNGQMIGTAEHERVIVSADRFMAKVNNKNCN